MKKSTFKNVSKKLMKYGALSAAIAGVADVNGQIVYTDITDFTGGFGADYSLDLNNDNIPDFLIEVFQSHAYYGVDLSPTNASNSFLASQTFFDQNIYAMNSGDVISAGQASWFNSDGAFNASYCGFGSAVFNWCGVTNKYLGVRFKIGANTHYGWARLDVNNTGDSFTVKDYAYNSAPGESINAGQQVLGVDDNEFNAIKIVALNKSIAISNITDTIDYNLFDISGKIVMSNQIKDNTHVIEANSLSTGVYILELKATNSDKIIRRKVVL